MEKEVKSWFQLSESYSDLYYFSCNVNYVVTQKTSAQFIQTVTPHVANSTVEH